MNEPLSREQVEHLICDGGDDSAELYLAHDAALRAKIELQQKIIDGATADSCELERELEKRGLVFYDDYGGLDPTAVITKYIDTLTAELAAKDKAHIVKVNQYGDEVSRLMQELARVTGELQVYRHNGLTEEILRRHDGYLKLGTGCTVVRSEEWDQLQAQLATAQAREARLREEFSFLIDEVDQYTTERQYHSRDAASKDLDRREKALLARLAKARAALTEPTSS